MKPTARLRRHLPLYVVKCGRAYVAGAWCITNGPRAQSRALAWRSRARAQRMADAWGKHWGMRVVRVVAKRKRP